jgi:hypothetical protein
MSLKNKLKVETVTVLKMPTILNELDQSLEDSVRDRECLVKGKGPEVSDCEINRSLLKKGLGKEVSMPSVPPDWVPSIERTEKNEPAFHTVDNPGKWPEYTYRSKFEKNPPKNQPESF